MAQGWAKIHRSLLDHNLWLSEAFTRGQAWVDLFTSANHALGNMWLDGASYPVSRGAMVTSVLKLSARWKWSRDKVRRFLEQLAKSEMIRFEIDTKKTLITVLNYETYQGSDQDDRHQSDTEAAQEPQGSGTKPTTEPQLTDNRTTTEQQQNNTNKKIKELKEDQEGEEGKEAAPVAPPILKLKIPESLQTRECIAALNDWIAYLRKEFPHKKIRATSINQLLKDYHSKPAFFVRDVLWSIRRSWESVNEKREPVNSAKPAIAAMPEVSPAARAVMSSVGLGVSPVRGGPPQRVGEVMRNGKMVA